MSKFNLKHGDRVIFRQWNDMAQEYGYNGEGNINVKGLFIEEMRFLCGRVYQFYEYSPSGFVRLFNHPPGVVVTEDMIYPVVKTQKKASID